MRQHTRSRGFGLSVLVLVAAAMAGGASDANGQATTRPATPAYQIYRGNVHAHTAYTWSHGDQWAKPAKPDAKKVLRDEWQKHQGPPAEHFARAKAAGYDFYVVSDHSQEKVLQPVSPENPQWVDTKRAAAEATDANFVALAGFEHSENNGPGGTGHINIINSAEYLNALAEGIDLPRLYQWLPTAKSNHDHGGGPVVASFNHPGPKQYADWAHRDQHVTEVAALLEVINSNQNVKYEAFVKALDKGWKVAPVCGNDNHGFWGITHQTSRTFVLATERTKPAILDAMKHRRTYASLENNIQCRYSVNDQIMGSTLDRPSTFRFDIIISDPDTREPKDRITRLDIVKDGGAVVATYEPPTPSHELKWDPTISDPAATYFFVRVWNAGGGDVPKAADATKPIAWLAPIWTGR